jgi:hypothetical protein
MVSLFVVEGMPGQVLMYAATVFPATGQTVCGDTIVHKDWTFEVVFRIR